MLYYETQEDAHEISIPGRCSVGETKWMKWGGNERAN